MRVVVYGAGAIGGLFGALLQRADHDVLLVARELDVVAIRLHGLTIEGSTTGTFEVPAVDALTDGMEVDAVLLTVKSYDVRAAAAEIGRRLRPVPPLLALENGLGILDLVRAGLTEGNADLPEDRLYQAVNTVPATRLAPGRLRQAGTGEVVFGTPSSEGAAAINEGLRALLASAGVPTRTVVDLTREVWRKAVINAAINPVTADHGIPNGQLARDPWRGQAEGLLHEALAVAHAEGVALPAEEAEADLWRIVRATASNRSSMLQDLDRGHRTEVGEISGALLALGARHGLPMPATRRVVERIRAREPPALAAGAGAR